MKKVLRTGNWIWRPCCNDQVVEVRENGIIGLDSLRGLIPFAELKPIELNYEILTEIGFKTLEINDFEDVYFYRQNNCTIRLVFKDYCTLINIDRHCVLNDDHTETIFNNEMMLKGKIDLHTLQNIWQLLTNEELEVNL